MSDTYYVITGTTSNGNNTEEVILERDEETGEVTKSISTTHAETLTQDEKALVESCGVTVEKVSKDEAQELEQQALTQVGADTAAGAPVFDQGSKPAESKPSTSSGKADAEDKK